MPASWESETCTWTTPSASAWAATVPRISKRGRPVSSETISASCQAIPTGAPSALAMASFAANRAASEAAGRDASASVNSRPRRLGVRSRDCTKRSMSTTSMPTPMTGILYSTVTDLARLRGWSTSWPSWVASSHAKSCSGTTATRGWSSTGTCGSVISTSA